jgi:hypothetical protein
MEVPLYIYNQTLIQRNYIGFRHNMNTRYFKQGISASSSYGKPIQVKVHT